MADEQPATKTARESVHDAIQASAALEDDLNGAVLVGWVCMAEWMSGDGERWISRMAGNATNDGAPPIWQIEGYLHHGLHSNWMLDEEDDDANSD